MSTTEQPVGAGRVTAQPDETTPPLVYKPAELERTRGTTRRTVVLQQLRG